MHKAQVLQNFNVGAVIVVNADDELFRMRIDELRDNDVDFPLAMISKVDGKRIQKLIQESAGRTVQDRLVASHECFELEKKELQEKMLPDEQRKSSTGSTISDAKQKALGEKESFSIQHRLNGVLAPSGRLNIYEKPDDQTPSDLSQDAIQSFDFITTSFSGRLPVGVLLDARNTMVLSNQEWQRGENQLTQYLLKRRRMQPNAEAIFLSSPNTAIFPIEDALPSQLDVFVAVISQQASTNLLTALKATNKQVLIEPMHSVLHRWKDLQLLLDRQGTWPLEKKARRKLIARYNKTINTNGNERHVSTCWDAHFRSATEHLEL